MEQLGWQSAFGNFGATVAYVANRQQQNGHFQDDAHAIYDDAQTKPTPRRRPIGRTIRNQVGFRPDDDLAEVYDPDFQVAQSLLRPTKEVIAGAYARVRAGDQWVGPGNVHRMQIIRPDGRMLERKVRGGKGLYDLAQTPEYRRAKFFEMTGDWPARIAPDDYDQVVMRPLREGLECWHEQNKQRLLEAERDEYRREQVREARRTLRESCFDFAPDDNSAPQNPMQFIDQEYIPQGGMGYFRNLYLADHWKMIAKCFYERHHNELAKTAIQVTSDFVLGRGLGWKIKDDRCSDIWDEFWARNDMERYLRVLVEDLTWQGELLIRKYEVLRGFVNIQSMDPSGFFDIVTDPKDIRRVFYYSANGACLDGDTRIPLLDGTEPTVRELAERNEPYWVYSYNHETKRIVPGKASKTWRSGVKRCVKVTLDNDESVVCTYDHPFLMRDGTYVWAEKLEPGDSLMPLYRRIGEKGLPGYRRLYQPSTYQYEVEHKSFTGRVAKGSVVHHVNFNKLDNRPENLRVMTREAHQHLHMVENSSWNADPEKRAAASAKISAAAKAREASLSDEQREARAERTRQQMARQKEAGWRGHWFGKKREVSEAWRQKNQMTEEKRQKIIDAFAAKPPMTEADHAALSERQRAIYEARPELREQIAGSLRTYFETNPLSEKASAALERGRQIRLDRVRAAHEADAEQPTNHKVVSVEPAGDREVYDLQVDEHHNFALGIGVFTHNTQWQQTAGQMRGVPLNVPSLDYIIDQYPAPEMIHVKINVSASEKWGRSDFYNSLGTLKRHRDWVNATTLKDMLQANLVWKIVLKGDEADVNSFINDQNNATLPAFGGTWVENEALTLEALHADVAQGGGRLGPGSTGAFLTALFAAAQQMPVTYFNQQGSGTARAVALTQAEPFAKKIATRQQVVRALLDQIYEEVMRKAVEAGRLERWRVGLESADPEWIFPSLYEEDRNAKFEALTLAFDQKVLSHRTLATQEAQELGLGEYDYEAEMEAIKQEQAANWPPQPPQPTMGPDGMPMAPEQVEPGMQPGQPQQGIPGLTAKPGVSGLSQSRGEKIKGADERADFRKEFRGHSIAGLKQQESLRERSSHFSDCGRTGPGPQVTPEWPGACEPSDGGGGAASNEGDRGGKSDTARMGGGAIGGAAKAGQSAPSSKKSPPAPTPASPTPSKNSMMANNLFNKGLSREKANAIADAYQSLPGSDAMSWNFRERRDGSMEMTVEYQNGITFKRTLSAGNDEVYRDLLVMPKEFQGQGYGKDFVEREEQAYRAMGIKRVSTLATTNPSEGLVGAYVWARVGGYRFADPDTGRSGMGNIFRKEASTRGDSVRREVLEFLNSGRAMTPSDFANFTLRDGTEFGKAALTKHALTWDAVKDL